MNQWIQFTRIICSEWCIKECIIESFIQTNLCLSRVQFTDSVVVVDSSLEGKIQFLFITKTQKLIYGFRRFEILYSMSHIENETFIVLLCPFLNLEHFNLVFYRSKKVIQKNHEGEEIIVFFCLFVFWLTTYPYCCRQSI